MPITFHFAARSHVGMVRSNNQDSGYAGQHLLAMADGMGGHAGGDIASSVVVGSLVELDEEALSSNEAGGALLAAIHHANEELASLMDQDPRLEGMGTTLIAILRSHNRLVLAHIGDSRAFLARGGQVTQITKDHSYVQRLVDEGRITSAEAGTHPQRSLVTRVLTGRPEDEPDLVVREAVEGDRYLIASDGLTDYVAADTINDLLLSPQDPSAVADALVSLALKAGAPDNVTVVIGDVVDGSTTLPSVTPQIVGSAAVRRRETTPTRPIPVTPAEKAAALSESTRPPSFDEPDDEVTLAEEDSSPVKRRLRLLVGLLAGLLVVVGGGFAAYTWTQRQLYVGNYQGNVTLFQGIHTSIGPVDLYKPLRISEVKVDDLPSFYAARLAQGVDQPDEASAAALIDTLRIEAANCLAMRARGQACATTAGDTTPVPSQTTTGTTVPTPTTGATTRAASPTTSRAP